MKKHVKIYMEFFDFGEQDFIPCEICGRGANDIHHIDARGKGGSFTKDHIENLMAVCREHHDMYGDKKQHKLWLKQVHGNYVERYLKGKS